MAREAKSGTLYERARRKWIRAWTDFTMARKKRKYRRRVGPPDRKIAAFIVGCQRSGTDMVIKTLDRSLDVERYDEYDELAFDDCRIRDKPTRDRLIEQSPAKCTVFKPVCDSHRTTELLAEHPRAKAVWIYRHFEDVANSAVERWGDKTKRWIEDLLAGGGDWGSRQWNKEKVTEECLAEVREATGDCLSPHEAAVLFWYMRNRTFFEQNLGENPDTIIVRYEQAVEAPREEFERICSFLDIGFYPKMVSNVFASSVHKRPFPDIQSRIRTLCEQMYARLNQGRAAR